MKGPWPQVPSGRPATGQRTWQHLGGFRNCRSRGARVSGVWGRSSKPPLGAAAAAAAAAGGGGGGGGGGVVVVVVVGVVAAAPPPPPPGAALATGVH